MSELVITPLGTVSPYCKGNKNCPGFLIEYNGYKYLFDCGNGITSLLNFPHDLNNLKILISHLHVDHYGDILSIAQSLLVYKRLGYISKNIDVYIPSGDIVIEDEYYSNPNDHNDWGTKNEKKHIIGYDYIHSFEKNYPINVIDYEEIDIKDDDVKISSLLVPHQLVSYAFRIDTKVGSVVYSSDTGSKNDLITFAFDCDLFICESTFLKGQYRESDNHLYAYEAGMIAKRANVKKLLLTHFWPEINPNEYVDEAKAEFENTQAAEEGKKLVLRRN